jgi:hypothetical protein
MWAMIALVVVSIVLGLIRFLMNNWQWFYLGGKIESGSGAIVRGLRSSYKTDPNMPSNVTFGDLYPTVIVDARSVHIHNVKSAGTRKKQKYGKSRSGRKSIGS